MYHDDFVKAHIEGLAHLIGIELISTSTKDKAIGHLVADRRHFTVGGRVHGGIIMALADTTASYGAVLNLPPNCGTTTLEAKTNFLAGGPPGLLIAESVPVHIGKTTMVWQTIVSHENGKKLALVVQTQVVLRNGAYRA